MPIKGLVNKPQFDNKIFLVGHPVRLFKDMGKATPNTRTYTKFMDGDYGLIQSVSPLSICVLLVDNKIAQISVDDVSEGSIIIDLLE